MKIGLVNLKREYQEIKPAIDRAVARVLLSGQFVLGPEVEAFEKELAAYCRVPFAVGLGSGTEGLVIALRALGLGPGDEVIAPAYTFPATVSSIIQIGARPILVDIDPQTYLLDSTQIKAKITSKTRAIIVVHLYGQPVPMRPFSLLAKKYHLKIIEDAAQAIGATYQGKRVGRFGHAAIFSFYPTKNLGAYGEGGALVTKSPKIADLARALRSQGETKKGFYELVGYNSRIDSLQAAILRVKLKRLESWQQQRQRHAQRYSQRLKNLPLTLPYQRPDGQTNWHLFVIRSQARDRLRDYLEKKGITCGVYYPTPLYLSPAFKNLGYQKGTFPESEKAAQEGLALPMFPQLKNEEIDYICRCLSRFYQ